MKGTSTQNLLKQVYEDLKIAYICDEPHTISMDEIKVILDILDNIGEFKMRIMKLHQEKLEVALIKKKSQITFTQQELKDLCEFLNMFLYN